MREIKLEDTLQEIVVLGKKYTLDINDFESINAITHFKNKYSTATENDELLEDCEEVIDIVLGEGTYDQLFKDKKTMKAYLLVNELANIYLELFNKEERDKQEAKTKEEIEKLASLIQGFNTFTNTVKYAENKYGMKKHVSRKSSKKYRNKK